MSLSARRAKFVNEYMLDHNGSRAARAAGYAVSSASLTAHRLIRNDKVKAAIELKSRDLAQEYNLTKHDLVRELRVSIAIAESKLDAQAMIRGWVEIAKIMGFYSTEVIEVMVRKECSVLRTKLEAMSDEDLIAIAEGGNSPYC